MIYSELAKEMDIEFAEVIANECNKRFNEKYGMYFTAESVYLTFQSYHMRLTPMMILLEGDGYADGSLVYDTAICPVCGYVLDDEFDVEDNHEPYCPHCGQKLNWNVGVQYETD